MRIRQGALAVATVVLLIVLGLVVHKAGHRSAAPALTTTAVPARPATPTAVPSSTPAPTPATQFAWFSGVVGRTVHLAMDEPDLHRTPPGEEQHAVRITKAGSGGPVAVTFFTPNCTVNRAYLADVDVYIDDVYPAFVWNHANLVAYVHHQVKTCLRRLAPTRAQYWLNLQAFGPGVTGYGPSDRWRCLSAHELDAMVRIARVAGVQRVLFWDRKVACPSLLPTIDGLTQRSSSVNGQVRQ
jgi:hypothetical protein